MERLINILIIDNNPDNIRELYSILNGGGNNLIAAESIKTALPIIEKREVGIILINIQNKSFDSIELLQILRNNPYSKEAYKIAISDNKFSGIRIVKGLKEGAVDYITSPFDSNLVLAKIEVFKTLYFKDLRISQLLKNIFPGNVLYDLNTLGKFSPRKIEQGVVLFTDFKAFTKTARELNPMQLISELEEYFKKFDEIINRYNLEKIKTIGDAYMVLAGVTEQNKMPVVRMTLATLEIRDYVLNKKKHANNQENSPWDIRIGIHSGPLVAGIIGSQKISFDVWGDTVNIASRAEQNSLDNSITITSQVAKQIGKYFDLTKRGKIEIKHGGYITMYIVNNIKKDYSLFRKGRYPNSELRKACDLPSMDYENTRNFILQHLAENLPKEMDYHNIKHTLNVKKAAVRLAKLEGIDGEDLILLKTAVLFHDSGFIYCYEENEQHSILLAEKELPRFGYSSQQIEIITNIIHATRDDTTPQTLLEKIMCDADHDYFGRPDYHNVAKTLKNELDNIGKKLTHEEWIAFQLDKLENKHQYYTQTAQNIRGKGKEIRISELKQMKKTTSKIVNS